MLFTEKRNRWVGCNCHRAVSGLHDKQQREGLTVDEQEEEQALLALYRETTLIRAQAAVLLKARGYNVSDPQQFAPLGWDEHHTYPSSTPLKY